MIVDLHANLYAPEWYPEAFRKSVVNEFIRRQKDSGRRTTSPRRAESTLDALLTDRDGSRTLRLMDEVGIDKKAVMILDWGLALGEAALDIAEINERILNVCTSSGGRLMGYAGVDPRRPDAVSIVERAFDDWGATGLKLHPTSRWRLQDEVTHAVVSVAVARRAPVLIHTGDTIDELSDEHARPADVADIARDFPDGIFISGHAGFGRWKEYSNLADLPANLHCDISGWQTMTGPNGEALQENLFGLMQLFPNRVHFGTDGPFYSYNLPAAEQHWLRTVRTCLDSAPEALRSSCPEVLDSAALLTRANAN